LLNVKISSSGKARTDEDMDEDGDDESESWTAEAHFTNANYQAKKFVFLLFINRK